MCNHKWIEDTNSMHRFVVCVNPENCNKKAHKGITYIEVCKYCGIKRKVNKNKDQKEYGLYEEYI